MIAMLCRLQYMVFFFVSTYVNDMPKQKSRKSKSGVSTAAKLAMGLAGAAGVAGVGYVGLQQYNAGMAFKATEEVRRRIDEWGAASSEMYENHVFWKQGRNDLMHYDLFDFDLTLFKTKGISKVVGGRYNGGDFLRSLIVPVHWSDEDLKLVVTWLSDTFNGHKNLTQDFTIFRIGSVHRPYTLSLGDIGSFSVYFTNLDSTFLTTHWLDVEKRTRSEIPADLWTEYESQAIRVDNIVQHELTNGWKHHMSDFIYVFNDSNHISLSFILDIPPNGNKVSPENQLAMLQVFNKKVPKVNEVNIVFRDKKPYLDIFRRGIPKDVTIRFFKIVTTNADYWKIAKEAKKELFTWIKDDSFYTEKIYDDIDPATEFPKGMKAIPRTRASMRRSSVRRPTKRQKHTKKRLRVHEGPRGGRYVIKNGRKCYLTS